MKWLGLSALAAAANAAPQIGMPGAGARGGTASGGYSLLRFGCSQVSLQRIDPLVNPGQVPSTHMHQIVGGNAFNATMPSTDISKIATCTTCSFSEDLSNYWTANMYFRAQNGTYKRVKQIPNRFLQGANAGITVYYISPGAKQTTAFKPGFRMLALDANRRASWMKSQSCFRCYTGPNFGGDNMGPCTDPRLDTEDFPKTKCYGIRSTINFPTCWDGKNLDTANHQDHMSYPTKGPAGFSDTNFKCPDSHPVRVPQISLEIVWDTTEFNDLWDPAKDPQPFRLSMSDKTGFGQHGDYVFGWKDDSLQKAMDGGCFGPTCAGLLTQPFTDANKCQVKDIVAENIGSDGWLQTLPGQQPEA